MDDVVATAPGRPAAPTEGASPRPGSGRRAGGAVFEAIRLGASGALLLAVIGIAVVTVVIPRLNGWTPLTVLTSSMSPALPAGTLVVVQPVDASALAVGDVVTYQLRSDDPTLVTHRIVSITATSGGAMAYVLKGDNNPDPDVDPVLPEQVQGRVTYAVPLLGYVNSAMSGAARGWLITGTAALLLGYAAYSIVGAATAGRRRRFRRHGAGRRSAR
jgi:signal peptidase I